MSGVERKTCMTREDATISVASDFRNAPAHQGALKACSTTEEIMRF